MSNQAEPLLLHDNGDRTVARFTTRIVEGDTMKAGLAQVSTLLEAGRRNFVMNFDTVEYLSSGALGQLINLHRMLWSTGGKLALVNVAPEVLEVFAITKLNQVFRINNKDDAGLELEPDETTDTEHDEDPGTESAGVPSRLIPPKPSRSGAVKLPLPRQEPESMQ